MTEWSQWTADPMIEHPTAIVQYERSVWLNYQSSTEYYSIESSSLCTIGIWFEQTWCERAKASWSEMKMNSITSIELVRRDFDHHFVFDGLSHTVESVSLVSHGWTSWTRLARINRALWKGSAVCFEYSSRWKKWKMTAFDANCQHLKRENSIERRKKRCFPEKNVNFALASSTCCRLHLNTCSTSFFDYP